MYSNTTLKLVCAYPNFVTRMVYNTIYPFLHERVKKKVVFITETTRETLEEAGMNIDES